MKNYKESKTDYEIFSGLADKLNFKIKFTQNKNEMDWIKYIWNKSKTICKKKKIKIPNFQNFWNPLMEQFKSINENKFGNINLQSIFSAFVASSFVASTGSVIIIESLPICFLINSENIFYVQ